MNIDFSKLKTAEQKAVEFAEARMDLARDECARRIRAQISDIGQVNLAADFALGMMTETEAEAFKAWRVWVSEMRSAWKPLAQSAASIEGDMNWPPVPAAVDALVDRR